MSKLGAAPGASREAINNVQASTEVAEAPILITEQEVLFSTAVPRASRRAIPAQGKARRYPPREPDYMEHARMSPESSRL